MATAPMPTVVEIPPQQTVISSENVRKALLEGRLRRICILTIVVGCLYTITSLGGNIFLSLNKPESETVIGILVCLDLLSACFIILPPALILCCKCCNCCCNSQCPIIGYFVLAIFGVYSVMVYSIDDFISATIFYDTGTKVVSAFMIIFAILLFVLLISGLVISGKILCGCQGLTSRDMVNYQQLRSVANPNVQVVTFPVVQNGSNRLMTSGGSRDIQEYHDDDVPNVVTSNKDTQVLISD